MDEVASSVGNHYAAPPFPSFTTGAYVLGTESMEVVAKLPVTEQRDTELALLLKALGAFRRGEGGVTLPTDWEGVHGKLAAEFNELSAQTARTTHKLKSVETVSRLGGKASRRIEDTRLTGFWQDN